MSNHGRMEPPLPDPLSGQDADSDKTLLLSIAPGPFSFDLAKSWVVWVSVRPYRPPTETWHGCLPRFSPGTVRHPPRSATSTRPPPSARCHSQPYRGGPAGRHEELGSYHAV